MHVPSSIRWKINRVSLYHAWSMSFRKGRSTVLFVPSSHVHDVARESHITFFFAACVQIRAAARRRASCIHYFNADEFASVSYCFFCGFKNSFLPPSPPPSALYNTLNHLLTISESCLEIIFLICFSFFFFIYEFYAERNYA